MVKITENYPVAGACREIYYLSNRYGVEIIDWSNCEDGVVRDRHSQIPYEVTIFKWKIVYHGDDHIRYDASPTMRYSKLKNVFDAIGLMLLFKE